MGHRLPAVVGLVMVGTGLLAWFGWGEAALAPPESPATAAESPAPVAATTGDPAPAPTAPLRDSPEGDWVAGLWQPVELPLATTPEDHHAVVVTGRLTVRQEPWRHPAHVPIRLTRRWLDTILPTAADPPNGPGQDVVTTTDGEGRFALRFRAGAESLFLRIDAGGAWDDWQCLSTLPRPGATADLGDLWVELRGGLRGRVVDRSGMPLANVRIRAVDDPLLDLAAGIGIDRAARADLLSRFDVSGVGPGGPLPAWVAERDRWLPFPSTTTNDSGVFHLTGLRPGTHDLFAEARGTVGSLADLQVAPNRTTEVGAMTLRWEGQHVLFCTDERGRPWVDAKVALLPPGFDFGSRPATVDQHGRVQVAGAGPGPQRVAFGFPGGSPWLVLDLPAASHHLTVPRPRPLAVRLVDPAGTPVANGTVRLLVHGGAFRPQDRLLPTAMQPGPGPDGRHHGALPCDATVVATAQGHAPAIAAVTRDGPAELTLTLLPRFAITVRTIDRSGAPVGGAMVRLQVHQVPEHTFPGSAWDRLADDRLEVGRTGADGTLQVSVWDTAWSLCADHPDFGRTPGPRLRPRPGQVVDVVLQHPARLLGTLRLQGQPAGGGFRVVARQCPPPNHRHVDSGWLDAHHAVTDARGRFVFAGLDPGIWEVAPEPPPQPGAPSVSDGPALQKRQVRLDEGQECHLEIEVQDDPLAVPQITGEILLDGSPVAGALVQLLDPQRAPGTRPLRQLTTTPFGDFRFGDLPTDHEFELRVELPDQGRLQFLGRRLLRTPKAFPGPTATARFDVATGSLQLVLTQRQRPFADRMLRLRQLGTDGNELARFEGLTDALGQLRFERLPRGRWTIEPMHGGRCEPALVEITGTVPPPLAIEVR